MTYSTGGLIQASDYNTFNGSPTANVSGILGSVYNIGYGNAGYGQANVANVSVSGTVTATQWTTLVNSINIIRKHQSGAGFTNIGTYTAGQTINALNDISGNLTTAYTNRLLAAASGSTTTGTTYSPVASAVAGAAYNTTVATRSVTFASGDAARYFFNAGGKLNFVVSSVTNNDATARSTDAQTLLATNFGSWSAFAAMGSTGRTGTGGTLNTNATGVGYYTVTATAATTQTLCSITSTVSPYTTDSMALYVYSSAQNAGGNGDKGVTVYFQLYLNSPAHSTFNGTLNVTVNHRVDIVYPSTSYLTSTWGTPTVA